MENLPGQRVDLPVFSLQNGVIRDCSKSALEFLEVSKSDQVVNREISKFFPYKQCNGDLSKEMWETRSYESVSSGIQSFPWKFITSQDKEIATVVSLVTYNDFLLAYVNPFGNTNEEWDKFKDQQSLLLNINQKIEEGIYRSSLNNGFYYVNKSFVKMFGFASEDEVLQLKPEDLNALYDMTNTRSDVLRQIENHGNIRNKEVLFRKKDGSRFWGLESCYLHVDEAGRKFIDGIIVDITPIKESENLLREKNHELQKVNEEMDRFVYSVSHDLRAPLSSVLGLLNLAEMETDPAQLSLFIQMMKKSVKKLDHFINEILDYSRNARLKLEDDRVDLETLTTEIIKSIEYMDGFERIRKSVKVYSRSEFVSDKKRIKIVLTNLITNAVLYHDSKKQNQFIEINAFIENESARIEVIDNGRGIQTTHLDKIFKMFYRASEDSKGSGLGLFMVKECVEKLEGTLNVSSTYGIGTKFEIVLKNFLANTARQSRLFGTSASA